MRPGSGSLTASFSRVTLRSINLTLPNMGPSCHSSALEGQRLRWVGAHGEDDPSVEPAEEGLGASEVPVRTDLPVHAPELPRANFSRQRRSLGDRPGPDGPHPLPVG